MDDSDLPAGLRRWYFHSCSFLTPTEWALAGEQDDSSLTVVPPTGPGRLVLSGLTDNEPPPFDRHYAVEQIEGLMRTLEIDAYRVEKAAEDHYRAVGEGGVRGRFVIGAAHVYAPNQLIVAYYHADEPDENRATAWSILSSIVPADWLSAEQSLQPRTPAGPL